MLNNYLLSAKGDPTKPVPEITSDHMRRWNKLIDFSKSKGYAGRPELDHNESLRQQVFNEYNKANPNDAIPYSPEFVGAIQNEMQTYKQKALSDIQKSKGSMESGTNANNFMSKISKSDNKIGQFTSQEKFPEAYIINKNTGEKKTLGFAPRVNLLAALQK